jgi:hypothetical protein
MKNADYGSELQKSESERHPYFGTKEEQNRIFKMVTRKYNFYKRAEEHVSFAFIAIMIIGIFLRYIKIVTLPKMMFVVTLVILSTLGIWMIVKKRVWRQRRILLEKLLH